MFLVPWLTLLISALVLIETRHAIPHGAIPMLLILAMLPLIGFCLISAAALVGESEGWLMAASIALQLVLLVCLVLAGPHPIAHGELDRPGGGMEFGGSDRPVGGAWIDRVSSWDSRSSSNPESAISFS